MTKRSIQVKPDKKGWALLRSGSQQTAGNYATKREATTAARRLAAEQNLDVIIYEPGRNFTEIRTSDSNLSNDRATESSPVGIETATRSQKVSLETKSQKWREWAAGHAKNSPALTDEAVSRESIYGDRGQ